MPLSKLILLLPLYLFGQSSTAESHSAPRFVRRTLTPYTEPAVLKVTPNYSPLTRHRASGRISASSAAYAVSYGHTHLADHAATEIFIITAKIQGENLPLILDTGSSDTWVAKKGFTCRNGTHQEVPQADCAFGPTFNGSYPNGKIKNENFLITYGNGYSVSGDFGYLDVSVAGVRVKNQRVALADEASIVLDNITSGLMGLGYSALTSAYVGTNISADNQNITGTAPGDQDPYSPIVQSMIAEGLNPQIFSLALERAKDITAVSSPGGYVAFGGLPPVAFDPIFVTTPIEIHEFYEYPPLFATNLSFYTITPHGYVTNNEAGKTIHHAASYPTIIDSGTLPMLVPSEAYGAYLKSIQPPPVEHNGSPYVPCTSTLPTLGVNVGGTVFNVSGADILYPSFNYTNQASGIVYCSLALANATVPLPGGGSYEFPILGATFLKNVVAVFDIGAGIMRIAQHNYNYEK